MKKAFIAVLLIFVVALVPFTLTACSDGALLNKLERAYNKAAEKMDKLDNLSSEDLSVSQIEAIQTSLSAQTADITNMSSGGLLASAADATKLQQIISIMNGLLSKQRAIDISKAEIKMLVNPIKESIKLMKDKDYKLTDEDKDILRGYIDEIKAATGDINGTIGKVYLKINGLKGKYNLQNIDMILQTFQEADAQMDIRVAAAASLAATALKADNFFIRRIG